MKPLLLLLAALAVSGCKPQPKPKSYKYAITFSYKANNGSVGTRLVFTTWSRPLDTQAVIEQWLQHTEAQFGYVGVVPLNIMPIKP
jgi:hypothetical protein